MNFLNGSDVSRNFIFIIILIIIIVRLLTWDDIHPVAVNTHQINHISN